MSDAGAPGDFPKAKLRIKRIGGGKAKLWFDGQNNGGSYLIQDEFLEDLLAGRRFEVYAQFVPDTEAWKSKRRKLSGDDNLENDDDSDTGAGSGAQRRDKAIEGQDRSLSNGGGMK
jgi:hypothetical protein